MSYEEQYASIFASQMEAVVFIILQIFFATCAVFKIREYYKIGDKYPGVGGKTQKGRGCLLYLLGVGKAVLVPDIGCSFQRGQQWELSWYFLGYYCAFQ